jgi:ribonuclease P protein component
MLSQKYRFHGHGSLRYVYKHGNTVRGRIISIKYTANFRRNHSRISVVVSKKVLKSAVGRNRIRRRIYEIIRRLIPEIDKDKAYDIVVLIFSREVLDMPHDELRDNVISQLKNCGILM